MKFKGIRGLGWLPVLLATSLWGCGDASMMEPEAGEAAEATESLKGSGKVPLPGKVPMKVPGRVVNVRATLDRDAVQALPDAGRYARDEICTFSAVEYSDRTPDAHEARFVLEQYFDSTFPNGLALGWAPRLRFTSAERVGIALPGSLPPRTLQRNQTDPERIELNRLGAELTALQMNIGFGDEGVMGDAPFGDAEVVGGPFDGFTVRRVAQVGHGVLSRHLELIAPLGIDEAELTSEIARLNGAARDCVPSGIIRRPR